VDTYVVAEIMFQGTHVKLSHLPSSISTQLIYRTFVIWQQAARFIWDLGNTMWQLAPKKPSW